jgi:hypothetical protein
MEIEYDFTLDDAQAYSDYFFTGSPDYLRQMNTIKNRFLFFPGAFILAAVIFALRGDYTVTVIFGLVAALLVGVYFVLPGILRRRMMKTAIIQNKTRLPEGKRKQKITLTSGGFTQTTAESTQTFPWNLVDDVVTVEKYLFIVVKGSGSVSVPERVFANEADYERFVAEAKVNWQRAET